MMIADGRRRACDLVGKIDYGFVLFIKQLAAMVKTQRLDLFSSDANPLRRSGMSGSSILASID